MRDRTIQGLAALLLLAAAAQAVPPDSPPPGPKAGNITALLPMANIVRGPAKQEVTTVAKKGDDVVWNDLIRTDKGGRARITLLDQSILSVGSQAQLRVIKSDAKSQQTSIEVGYGRVRMEVTPITQQGGSFEVKTPTAVAGVIGTTFGVDSAIGTTTFLCVSGTTMVGSSDPAIPGRVACTAGMAAVVSTGKAPTTRQATQQELQQMVQDTEPATISAIAPSTLLPGTTADASITGTQLSTINAVSSSSMSVTASLNPGGTATSLSVHLVVAANATPGPVTLTLSRPGGVNAAAVFTVSPSQTSALVGNAPSIQGLSTTTAPASGGSTVTITGSNFDSSTKVMFGSTTASNVTFVSSTQLTAVTPAGNPGPVDLTIVTGGGMTATLSGGFSFGGPLAAINPVDITVNPGAAVTLDGSQSSDTLAGTTLTYSWTFCALGFKPPQAGASLSAAAAPVCSPATGTVPGSDSQYALTPPTAPGQYFARLQVTDNLGASAVIYGSVTVSQPNYLDPLTCTTMLAQAYSTLQIGSPGPGCGSGGGATVLTYFDPNFPGLNALEQSIQTAFLAYNTMQILVQGPQLSAGATTSRVTGNWELVYTIKNDPACKHTTPCQPPTYRFSLGTVTTVWTLTPGVGWAITAFQQPNGFPQGTPPGVPIATNSAPELVMVSVQAQGIPGNPIPIGLGAQTFVATVNNVGTASSTATTVQFVLSQLNGTVLGTTTAPLSPIAPQGTATATGTITVPSTVTAVTQAQLVATANPGCTMVQITCANNSGTFAVVITPPNVPLPNLVTQITNVSAGATLGTGPQTIQATVTNTGNAPFSSSPPVVFSLIVSGNTVASTQVTITGPIAVGQVVPVQAQLTIPTTIAPGTAATLSVDASPTCPNPVQPSCTGNTATVQITIGVPASIIVTSSAGNTTSSSPVELNGALTDLLTLTATRSDEITTGSVTLGLSGTTVTPTPAQLTSIPYATPESVDFNAAIDGSGNVTTGPASVTVTPSNANPSAGTQATTLYFNIGDITLSLPAGTTCIQISTDNLAPVPSFSINAVNGFNVPTVNWQWSGLTGVTVNQVSGTATLSGTTYALPAFTFTVTTPETATFLFAVTVTNAQGSATKAFSLTFDLSSTACPGAVLRMGGGGVSGTWTRSSGGGMAKPTPTGPLPDLQINAGSVSYTPSIPKPGDAISVRFRVTNAGNADAQHVPIALVVNGTAVVSDTFDLRAGASTLAALEWANAQPIAGRGPMQAAVVVDPNHTVAEQSTLAKSAPLLHFTLQPAPAAPAIAQSGGGQRATLEVADGGCVGFNFASGAGSSCGSADVEVSVEQMSSGRFTLSAQIGIADLGSAFGGGKLAVVQYEQEAPAIAGHSYAVQLRGGKTGILRLMAIRNPGQAAAASRQAFGASKTASKVGTGSSGGPVETGDVSGVHTASGQSKAYFDVSYQTQ